MANNKVKHYRTNVAGRKPDPAKLEEGEIAINMADKHIFTKVGTKIVNIGSGADATVEGGQIFKGDVKANKLSTDTDIVSKNAVSSKISFVDEHDKEKVSIVSDAQTDGEGNLKITVQDGKATDRSSTFVINGNGTLNLPAAPVKAENATRKDYVDVQIKKTADKSASDLKTNVDSLNNKIDANDIKQSDALTAIDTTINAKIDANDLKQSNALTASDATLNKKIDANDAKQTKALTDSDKVLTDKINTNDTKQATNLKTNVDTLNNKIDANDLKQSNALTASDAALNKRIDEVDTGQTGAVNTKVSKAGDTMTGNLRLTTPGDTRFRLKDVEFRSNGSNQLIISAPTQAIHIRPKGNDSTEQQAVFGIDGTLTLDRVITRSVQSGEAGSLTRKDYVDAEVKKSVDLANSAKTDAANVLSTAKTAETKAANAENVANTANTTANTANTTAKTALDTANVAKTTATNANTNAESRVKRAGDTMSGRLNAPEFLANKNSIYIQGAGNKHLWFQGAGNEDRGLVYADDSSVLHLRSGGGGGTGYVNVQSQRIQIDGNRWATLNGHGYANQYQTLAPVHVEFGGVAGASDYYPIVRGRSFAVGAGYTTQVELGVLRSGNTWGVGNICVMSSESNSPSAIYSFDINGNFRAPNGIWGGARVEGNDLLSRGEIYGASGNVRIDTSGNVLGPVWNSNNLHTHIENRAAAHAQNGINRANEVNNRISAECITAFRLGGIQQGWGGNGAHDVSAGWVVTGMDKGQGGSTGNGTIQLRCKCIQVHIPNRGWVNAVDLWGAA